LGQALLSSAAPRLENGFSIGICAADHPAKLGQLLDTINREAYPAGFVLKSIIAMIGEVMSLSLAILDTTTAKPKHVPWTRFGTKS